MSDLPPSYEAATGSAAKHRARNGIPPDHRRSMEDESRPLPQGWVRQFDVASQHQFFIDTTKEPPRSIWQHPYDDEEYLNSVTPQEREHVTRLNRSVSLKDIEAESSDDDGSIRKGVTGSATARSGGAQAGPSSSSAPGGEAQPQGLKKFGRKLKDSITSSTHEERERSRQQRAQEEERAYALHLAYRRALTRAMQTGEPQLLGRDGDGKDVYVQPPDGPYGMQGVGGYNPYARGPYGPSRGGFLQPGMAYGGRPYGYGYGGGLGFPLMGGMMGGAMLGGMLI